jgi:hypothetical protein
LATRRKTLLAMRFSGWINLGVPIESR